MFLSAVLFVLFLAGCWLYCLTDAASRPPRSSAGCASRSGSPHRRDVHPRRHRLGDRPQSWRTRHRPLGGRPPAPVRRAERPVGPAYPRPLPTGYRRRGPGPPSGERRPSRRTARSARTTTPSSCACSTDSSAGPPTRTSGPFAGGTIGAVVLTAALAAGGLTTVRLLDSGHDGASTPVASGTPTAAGKASADSFGASLAGTPQVAAVPHVAVMPARKARAAGKPAPSRKPSGAAP